MAVTVSRNFRVLCYLSQKKAKVLSAQALTKVRRFIANNQLKFHSYLNRVRPYRVLSTSYISKTLITSVGIFISSALICKSSFINTQNINSDLFYVCAGIIGTILALTFSLSALPVQKATESFGGIISDIYKRDIIFKIIFLSLAIFCLISVFFGAWISFVDENPYVWFLACEIVFLAASLDLIKLYNERSTLLLTPIVGIKELSKQANRYFKKHNKQIKKLARLQRAALSDDEQKEISQSDLDIHLYQMNKNDKALQRYASDLIEIAGRSIVGKQNFVAGQSLGETSTLVGSYLKIYEDLFILKPATFGVSTSDANEVLSPILESLKDLTKLCLDAKDELAFKYVLRTMANITISILNVEAQKNDRYLRSISWLCLGYLETCTTDAIENDFPDAGLEGIKLLNNIVSITPSEIDSDKFFRQIIESQSKLCKSFYRKGNWLLAEYAINGMMVVLHEALKRGMNQRPYLWSAVFRELKVIFHGAQLISQAQSMTLMNCPMKAAHSATQELSFSRLLAKELNASEVDPEYPHSNPYHLFLECSEKLYEYMRDIARNYDLGDNAMLYDLIELLGEISNIYMFALENQLRPDRIDEESLIRKIECHHYFLSNVFYDKTNINHNYAENAAKVAAKAGLRAYDAGVFGLPKSCRNVISSIAKSWNRSGSAPDRFDHLTDDFFEYLWMFEKAAELRSDLATTQFVQKDIEELIAVFPKEKQAVIRERLRQGADIINQRLNDPYEDGIDLDGLFTILKRIKKNNIE